MWCLPELLVSKELISYPRAGNDHVLYSDEVVAGRVLNEKDVLSVAGILEYTSNG